VADPRVSVVIPAYNAERFLAEAIESVLAQAYEPLEIIVVDDGSTDATAAITRRFAPAVVCIGQPNAGIGAARNRGVDAAGGELLAFLDADDLWTPGRLRRQVDQIASGSPVDMVFGMVEAFVDQGHVGTFLHEVPPPGPGYLAGAMVVRRDTFRRVGPFATDVKVGEFIDWYARATDLGLTAMALPEVVLRRRLHDSNTGIRERDSRLDYARVLRSALARRRAAGERDS